MGMAEYIEREALYEKAYWHGEHPDIDNPFPDGVDAIDIEDVDAIPPADVAPVKHARWIEYTKVIIPEPYNKWEQAWKCSECGFDDGFVGYDYCPNCGAKMDGGND